MLADLVRLIRMVRPDVIISMSPDGGGGGQHHQTSARLTREAFDAAADRRRFPEQIEARLEPWQATTLYVPIAAPPRTSRRAGRRNRGGRRSRASAREQARARARATSSIDIDVFDSALGCTYAEIGTRARGMHKSQGMARLGALPGPAVARYRVAAGVAGASGTGFDIPASSAAVRDRVRAGRAAQPSWMRADRPRSSSADSREVRRLRKTAVAGDIPGVCEATAGDERGPIPRGDRDRRRAQDRGAFRRGDSDPGPGDHGLGLRREPARARPRVRGRHAPGLRPGRGRLRDQTLGPASAGRAREVREQGADPEGRPLHVGALAAAFRSASERDRARRAVRRAVPADALPRADPPVVRGRAARVRRSRRGPRRLRPVRGREAARDPRHPARRRRGARVPGDRVPAHPAPASLSRPAASRPRVSTWATASRRQPAHGGLDPRPLRPHRRRDHAARGFGLPPRRAGASRRAAATGLPGDRGRQPRARAQTRSAARGRQR